MTMSLVNKIRVGSFRAAQKLGIHITPNHFYEPIPDVRNIPSEFWRQPSELRGIEMNEQAQVALLGKFCNKYKQEFDEFPNCKADFGEFTLANTSFGAVDAEILYSMVRYYKPKKIIEIGSGNSTLVSARAILKNATSGISTEFFWPLSHIQMPPSRGSRRGSYG